MCLAIPGKVIEISGDAAVVDYGGVLKEAKLALVSPKVGDFVIVHAGFAIEILEKGSAEKTIDELEKIISSGSTQNTGRP